MSFYHKALILAVCITISACNSSSSSGDGDGVEDANATSCVASTDNGIENTCSFDINIDAGAGAEFIAAGETIQPSGTNVFISACRAPSVPKDEGELDFICE